MTRLAMPALALLTLTAACDKGPYRPSSLHLKLAPYRADRRAPLRYAARYLSDIYDPDARSHPLPVRPVLGLPALPRVGAHLQVHYLHRAPPARARQPTRLSLVLPGQVCPGPACRALPAPRVVRVTPLGHGVLHVVLRTRIPSGTPAGFYDLVHTRGAWRARTPSAVDVQTTQASRRRFTFVHLSDLHQGHRPDPRLRSTLDWVNQLRPRPAFAVVTGDLVEFGPTRSHWDQARQALVQLRVPVFVVPGNHDYYRPGFGGARPPKNGHVEELGLRHFLRTFHPFLAFRFAYGGLRFLAVDTGPGATLRSYKQWRLVTTEGLSGAQLADVTRFLATPAPRGHVLLGHAPPRARMQRTQDGCDPGRHGSFLVNRAETERRLLESWRRRRRPVLFLHGHLHWNDLYVRSQRKRCAGFEAVNAPQPPMGTRPCWWSLPTARSPLVVSTQSATKHNPLRSGGLLQKGVRFGEGAGASRGFRLIRVDGDRWDSALYRLYHRTALRHRAHPDGYLPPASVHHDRLPRCAHQGSVRKRRRGRGQGRRRPGDR